jgi:cell division protein FtsW
MTTLAKTCVALAGLLAAIGLVMVYSASMTSRPSDFEQIYLSRQFAFLAIATVAAAAAALLPPSFWKAAAPWLLGATLLLLTAVLIPGVGTSVNGATRWIRLGPISLQPSELAKIALPLYLCAAAADARWHTRGALRSWLDAALPTGLLLLLVLIEPDLGTTLFLAAAAALALFFSGWPLRRFLLGAALAFPILLTALALKPYQMARIQGFVAAWQDFDKAPYQVRQSLTAVGAGGLTGTGIGAGQQKLSFLPEANTDFVYAVIGEELGLAGTLGVLLLWSGLYAAGLRLAAPLRRGSFDSAAALTLLSSLVAQAGVNMAVVLALAPPKGISLPLISYGGSSLVCSALSLGILLSLCRAAAPPGVNHLAPPPLNAGTKTPLYSAAPSQCPPGPSGDCRSPQDDLSRPRVPPPSACGRPQPGTAR